MKIKVTMKAGTKFRSYETELEDEYVSNQNIYWTLINSLEDLVLDFCPDVDEYDTPAESGVNTYIPTYEEWMESDE